jgi:RNA polymerase sigma-70 factor (ECF subfamily)
MMREFLELTTDEICSNEMISANSLNVTLYRARLRLRECLENRWFQKEAI